MPVINAEDTEVVIDRTYLFYVPLAHVVRDRRDDVLQTLAESVDEEFAGLYHVESWTKADDAAAMVVTEYGGSAEVGENVDDLHGWGPSWSVASMWRVGRR